MTTRAFAFLAVVMVGAGLLRGIKARESAISAQSLTKPYGSFSRLQIEERSKPVCNTLIQCDDAFRLNCMPTVGYEGGRAQVTRLWIVDCISKSSGIQAHLVWNADTGELLSAACPLSSRRSATFKTATRLDAIRISGSWLTTLGISSQGSGWYAGKTRRGQGHGWLVQWLAKSREVIVMVDGYNGHLILAQSRALVTPGKFEGRAG